MTRVIVTKPEPFSETTQPSNEQYLALLNNIAQMALQAPDLTSLFQTLADRLGELIQADDCYVTLWCEDRQTATLVAATSRRAEPYQALKPEAGETALTTAVLQSEKAIIVHDVGNSPYANLEIRPRAPIQSILGAPLLADNQKLGAVIFVFQTAQHFSSEKLARCEQACHLTALAIAKAQLIEQANQRTEELEIIFKVSRVMRTARTRAEIPAVVLDQIMALFQVQGVALEIFDVSAGNEGYMELGRGWWADWTGKRIPATDGLSQQIISSGQPYRNNDCKNYHPWLSASEPAQGSSFCIAGMPLGSQDRVLGILWIGGVQPITERQVRLFTAIGDAIANALHRQSLHEKLQTQLEALRMAQARLVQSEKLAAIGELVAGVAHELNNPLTSVILYAHLIQQQTANVQTHQDMSRLIEEARRAANTVRGLLDFARQRPPERKLTQINEILTNTVDLLTYELRAHNIQYELHLSPDLPPAMIDPHQFQQVFINLINNAWQAMHTANNQGKLLITTKVGRPLFWEHSDQNYNPSAQVLRISIADNGPGIPADLMSRIFDPFFTTKPEGVGTGLGLSICHGIVSEHEGHLWVESQVGKGATFFVELPLRLTKEVSKSAPKTEAAPVPPPETSTTAKRILLIDDENSVLEVTARILRKRGYQVDTANNGTAGLACLFKSHYDFILSDIRMPELSGPDFYRQVAAKDPHLAACIVFTTGDTVNSATRRFLEETGVPYLTKPFELDDLLACLQQVVQAPAGNKPISS